MSERATFSPDSDFNALRDVVVKGDAVYINQSRINSLLKCEVLYFNEYEFGETGLQPKFDKLAFATGSAYHDGIAAYYHGGRDVNAAISAALATMKARMEKAAPFPEERELWLNDAITVVKMIEGYHRRYLNDSITVLMPEATGTVQLGTSPHHLVFRTDAIYEQYNQMGLLEYKTKGRSPSALEVAKIHLDIQPTAYIYGVRKLTKLHVEGVKYRIAIKKPEYDLNRMHLEEFTGRSEQDLARFEEQAIWTCERILELRKSGKWLHNFNQCYVFGECDFAKLCRHHNDESIASLYVPRETDYVDEALRLSQGA